MSNSKKHQIFGGDGYYLEGGEKARLERQRKFRQSVNYNNPLTPEGRLRLQEFSYDLGAYRRLIRFGLLNFDDQGLILVQDADTLNQGKIPGIVFLQDIITYFEQKDESYAYLYCANLKELIGVYNDKFGH
jgi:hypothetical protein